MEGEIVNLSPGGEIVSWKQLRFLEVEVYNGPLIGKQSHLYFSFWFLACIYCKRN